MRLDESCMSNRVELYLQKAGLSLKGERAVARHTKTVGLVVVGGRWQWWFLTAVTCCLLPEGSQ
jgi:hypothetical protein